MLPFEKSKGIAFNSITGCWCCSHHWVGFDPEKYSVDTTQGSDDFLSAGQFGRIFEETFLM